MQVLPKRLVARAPEVHLKQQGRACLSGIAFGKGKEAKAIKDGIAFDVLASLTENHYRGETSLNSW